MGIDKKDIDILDFLYKLDRKTLGEDVCERGHHFHKGKYDFCPICGCKFKAESENNNAEHTHLGRGVKIYKEEIEDIY